MQQRHEPPPPVAFVGPGLVRWCFGCVVAAVRRAGRVVSLKLNRIRCAVQDRPSADIGIITMRSDLPGPTKRLRRTRDHGQV